MTIKRPTLRVRKGIVLGRRVPAQTAEVRTIQAMLKGVVPAFFQRLLRLPLDGPVEFEFDGKLITITIKDIPDGDKM